MEKTYVISEDARQKVKTVWQQEKEQERQNAWDSLTDKIKESLVKAMNNGKCGLKFKCDGMIFRKLCKDISCLETLDYKVKLTKFYRHSYVDEYGQIQHNWDESLPIQLYYIAENKKCFMRTKEWIQGFQQIDRECPYYVRERDCVFMLRIEF